MSAAERRLVAVRRFDWWREAAYEVEATSRRWQTASAEERHAAALAFFAALDREEKAAAEYEHAWRAWRPIRSRRLALGLRI
jgi:hypothetical protein